MSGKSSPDKNYIEWQGNDLSWMSSVVIVNIFYQESNRSLTSPTLKWMTRTGRKCKKANFFGTKNEGERFLVISKHPMCKILGWEKCTMLLRDCHHFWLPRHHSYGQFSRYFDQWFFIDQSVRLPFSVQIRVSTSRLLLISMAIYGNSRNMNKYQQLGNTNCYAFHVASEHNIQTIHDEQ